MKPPVQFVEQIPPRERVGCDSPMIDQLFLSMANEHAFLSGRVRCPAEYVNFAAELSPAEARLWSDVTISLKYGVYATGIEIMQRPTWTPLWKLENYIMDL